MRGRMNVVTRETKSKHAAAEGITTTGLFAATAAAAVAGAALKTAVDQYKNSSDGSALERAFNAMVREFFTGTDNDNDDSARQICLEKMGLFLTFARNACRAPDFLTPDGKYGFERWQDYYTSETQRAPHHHRFAARNNPSRGWGETIDARGRANIARLRQASARRAAVRHEEDADDFGVSDDGEIQPAAVAPAAADRGEQAADDREAAAVAEAGN
jgi:hypothetical protein